MTHGKGKRASRMGANSSTNRSASKIRARIDFVNHQFVSFFFFYRSAHNLFLSVPCPSHAAGSPAGPTNTSPNGLATPKSGEPSSFQLTLSTLVYLLPSHAPFALAVAWYTFQISVPSGEVKKALCAVPRLPLADEKTGPDLVQESRTSGSAPSARVRSPSW